MSTPSPTKQTQVFEDMHEAIDLLAILKTILDCGGNPAQASDLRRRIAEACHSYGAAQSALFAMLAPDEEDPDLFDAEISMLARAARNQGFY